MIQGYNYVPQLTASVKLVLQSSELRAHRLSGHDPEDDEDDEFMELQGRDSTNNFETSKCLHLFSAVLLELTL